MSRIIVKGLPSGIKDARLKKVFGEVGTITDCSLKYTQSGHFRKFCFIGFSSADEGNEAVRRFNQSYIDTSKIVVELAKDFGDETKPRSWSKYSRDSSAYQHMLKKIEEKKAAEEKAKSKKEKKSKKKKGHKVEELLGDLKDDAEFKEFLEVHKNKTTKSTWTNDTIIGETAKPGIVTSDEKVTFDDSSDEGVGDSEEEVEDVVMKEEEDELEEPEDKPATKKEMSDLDYLKSKMSSDNDLLGSGDDDDSSDTSEADTSDDEEDEDEKKKSKKKSKVKQKTKESEITEEDTHASDKKTKKGKEKTKIEVKTDDDVESSSDDDDEDVEESDDSETDEPAPSTSKVDQVVSHVVKMRGMPQHVREKQIRDFFTPLAIRKIRIPKNAKGNNTSFATVEFKSEKDTDQAMRKNKNFIASKRIFLYKVKKDVQHQMEEKSRPWESKAIEERDEEDESIAESGRLYVRNLAYICKEEDLETLFGEFGPLTEVHVPIDTLTRKIKGFAFVTFMIPENAVQAFTKLDGSVFQGRMLHILPAKPKKEEDAGDTDGLSFKKKRELKQKAQAGSSHNWNTLFLGANVVADVMAEKYGAEKSQILDAEGKHSLGVRLALGETEIVSETRKFLVDNGVSLDSFSQAAAARSKTVILVKNLPAGTKPAVIKELFAKHGLLGRVVLPPSGVTAIVEYLAPTEARSGFRSLAYSKFQHVPLYLEWAPIDVFTSPAKPAEEKKADGKKKDAAEQPMEQEAETKEGEEEEESSSESEDEAEPGSTLFVKSLNFETGEKELRNHFSSCGDIRAVTISKKKDMKNPGQLLSMGYGFVEFKRKAAADKALKILQHSKLDDHQLELKVSNKTTVQPTTSKKKQDTTKKQKSSKILVRNIPFEAKLKEIKELFSTFGELKALRLPKKLGGTGSHRGFCFVDFLTKQDAKRAFNALCHSTHLYGRRLVLEWAESDESVDQLRKKTAEHFHEEGPSKRLKKSDLLNELKLSADD